MLLNIMLYLYKRAVTFKCLYIYTPGLKTSSHFDRRWYLGSIEGVDLIISLRRCWMFDNVRLLDEVRGEAMVNIDLRIKASPA